MKYYLTSCLLAALLLNAGMSFAVDENRLWLPKKYRDVMPKLVATATLAEQRYRCEKVIAGEMIVSKSSQQTLYFVVTCRDLQQKSFNLSYLYSVAEDKPELVAEQGRLVQSSLAQSDGGVDDQQRLAQCRKAMFEATTSMPQAQLREQEITSSDAVDGRYHYILPFDVQSPAANLIRYQAKCEVDSSSGIKVTVELHTAGAIVLCKEALPAKTLFLKQQSITDQAIKNHSDKQGFHFDIPFTATNLNQQQRQFRANCQIDQHGRTELDIAIDPDSVLSVCSEEIVATAGNMRDVVVLDGQQDKLQAVNGGYSGVIRFDAKNPGGRVLHYQAKCQLDKRGRSSVELGPIK
jgi:hypothetical protein